MNSLKSNEGQKSINDFNLGTTSHKVNILGVLYMVLGSGGLTFSIFSLCRSVEEMEPMYGSIIGAILVGTISQFILVYGCNVMKRGI